MACDDLASRNVNGHGEVFVILKAGSMIWVAKGTKGICFGCNKECREFEVQVSYPGRTELSKMRMPVAEIRPISKL